MGRPHIVVVGGGFGGLQVVRHLKGVPVEITLVDRRNHHLFPPLLYQVATGGLSPANISAPLRAILKRQANAQVLLGEVIDIDTAGRRILLPGGQLPYDILVLAAGSVSNYYDHGAWQKLSPGLKTLEDATDIRCRILSAFEEAERVVRFGRPNAPLTFVIVGGGTTGIEMAGAVAELKGHTLRDNFRNTDPSTATILLLEGGDRLLPGFPADLADKASRVLKRLGVTIRTRTMVTGIQPAEVTIKTGDTVETIPVHTVIWTAGVRASPLGAAISRATGAATDRSGRIIVGQDMAVPGHPEILVVGDLAHFEQAPGQPLAGLAPVAIQEGRYVARLIRSRLQGKAMPPFVYKDRGTMATIGRGAAIVNLGWLRFNGGIAWLIWLFVHLLYIVDFENRLLVLIQWAWSYFTRNRSARLIAGR